jgi:hypothetical protein
MRVVAIVLIGIAAGLPASRAQAAPATLAALAPSSDARRAVAIGPSGQVYEPDGKGAWVRRRAGGTSVDIVGATAIAGKTTIAITRGAAPFKLAKSGAWSGVFLTPKARNVVVGAGTRVLAAVGKQVFALDTTAAQAKRLGDAPGPVKALAASRARAIVMTDKGLHELAANATAWKPIKKAPRAVRSLVSDRWAIVDRGVLDLKTLKTIAWPAGVRVDEVTTVGDTLIVVASKGKNRELLTLSGRAAPAPKTKAKPKGAAPAAATTAGVFDREDIPLDGASPVIGVVADDAKRVAVATKDGKIALRVGGSWTVSEVKDELPEAKPGSPPALSASR